MPPGVGIRPGMPQQFEKMAEQIKTQAREKQAKITKERNKTDEGLEQLKQKRKAVKTAIKNVKQAIAQLQAQADDNPQLREHPMFLQRMMAYEKQLKDYEEALKRIDSQIEMLNKRKEMLKNAFYKVSQDAMKQLATIRQRQAEQKRQKEQADAQKKKKSTKQEGSKTRG